jgi:transposase-like protein
VERILEVCLSVAQVAREEGVNANQLHRWRREYQAGLLPPEDTRAPLLLPVQVESVQTEEVEVSAHQATAPSASSAEVRDCIHIEIEPARTAITAEHGTDPTLLSITLEALRR